MAKIPTLQKLTHIYDTLVWASIDSPGLGRNSAVTCTFRQVSFPPTEQPGSFHHCEEEDKEHFREENSSGIWQEDRLVEEEKELKELVTGEVVASQVKQQLIS